MAKQPFRSIGMRVRDFARSHIRSYVSSGETVSRSSLTPSWQDNADEPLVWREDAPEQVAPEAAEPYEAVAAPEDASPYPMRTVSSDQITPNMLQRLLDAHEERIAREEAEKAALMASQPPPVQRQTDGDGTTPMPPRRRRGAVIDITPPHTSAHSEDEPTSDAGSPDDFFLNEATPTAVQRAPEVSPAPPSSTKRVTPSSRASNPATSFWRKLFSRGDETSTTTEDIPSAEPDDTSAEVEYSAFHQDEMPASRQADTSAAVPSVQRKSEQLSRRTQQSASAEPAFEQSYESEQTVAGSLEDALSYPGATQTAPTTQTSAPSIQRKPETSRRSRSRASQQHPSHETPSTPPSVQRETIPETHSELPDQGVISGPPSSPAVQRAPASEMENSFSSAPVSNAPPSQPGRRARRSTGQSGQSAASVQRKRNAERDVINSASPPQSDSVQPEGEQSQTVPEVHETATASPASAQVQRDNDSAKATQPPSEPARRSRKTQTSSQPAAPEASHLLEQPTSVPSVHRKAAPPAAPQSAPTGAVETAAHAKAPSTPVEQSSQSVVQRSSAVTSAPNAVVPDSGNEQSNGETLARPTTATNQPAEIPRIQRKSRSGRSSSSAPVSGQAARPPVRDTSSPDVQRHISETSPENSEFTVEPQLPSAVVTPSQTTLNQPVSQATPPAAPTQPLSQPKAPSTPNVQPRRSSDAANTPMPTKTTGSIVPPVQREQGPADDWQDVPSVEPEYSPTAPPGIRTEQPLSTTAVPPQSTAPTAGHSTPHIQRATSDESNQGTATPAEPPAPRQLRTARNVASQTDVPTTHTNAETPLVQRHMNVPQADEATRLTPIPPQSQQPSQATPPHVQRVASQRTEQQAPLQPVPDDNYSTPDTPTILTAVPPQTIPPHSTAVQRETATDVGTTTTPEPRQTNVSYVPPSPWAAFMQPPEHIADVQRITTPTRGSAAANAPRAQTPAPIQRTPEAEVPGFISEDVSDDLPPVGENEIDLFTAMMNTGMIPPQTQPPAPAVTGRGTPPNISRSSAPETGSRPTPKQPSQHSPSGPPGTESSPEQQVPDAESADADLLSLLNLPPTTPVIRQKSSESAVARFSETAAQHEHDHQSIPPGYIAPPDVDDWGSIQRAINVGELTSSVSEGEAEGGQQDVDVDKLARDVLDVLRQRLRVERERRGGKP